MPYLEKKVDAFHVTAAYTFGCPVWIPSAYSSQDIYETTWLEHGSGSNNQYFKRLTRVNIILVGTKISPAAFVSHLATSDPPANSLYLVIDNHI